VAAPVTPVDLGAALEARVSALLGAGELRPAHGAARPLSIAEVLREGDSLVLAPGAQAHVRISDGTAFIASDGAALQLATLREHAAVLALQAGSVTQQVHPLAAAERYEVRAAGYVLAVRGTRFRVSLEAAQLTAAVSEGHVTVTDAGGQLVSDLIAPAVFRSAPRQTARSPGLVLPAPRLPTAAVASWPVLTLPAWPAVEAVGLEGSTFPTTAELALRVPAGDVALVVRLANGREHTLLLPVPEGGQHVETAVLTRLLREAEAASVPEGHLDASTIRGVIAAGTPALQRCYELSLKQRPDIAGRISLRISIDAGGQVRRVTPRNDEAREASVPDGLVQCIRAAAERWRFPSPGGPLTFEAPIRLARSH
jgi:hypothetical protein